MAWLEENERWSSTKVRWLLDHIGGKMKKSDKNKVIVACHSLASLDVVAVALKAKDLSFLRIDGSVVGKDRSRTRHQFQDQDSRYRILLLTTKVGGVALNLTAANIIYMISPEWSAAAEAQLEFRIYRLGQKQETEVIRIYANNSADLRCKSLQDLKKKKEWGILDVLDHDVSTLEEDDETRLLVEKTREKLEEMKMWDRKRFEAALRGVYREDRRGGLGLGVGQNPGPGPL
ncbi:hypothetical protein BTUL_0018g00740 [Botrytis tulipae]|uniref:Helicase C-terminal domain-containing protein n=1 Tax=Botrytis tulipae TaxID=87230 RepID=A0A4Z1F842_9HELO|nr:hypothetical protein BTUL_0018g00740 [Botrytis tulipae]